MGKNTQKRRHDAVVLGCGVLGLSIAHELTRKGLKVVVVGKDLPEDIHSTGFASPWAGANWHSFASNPKERRRDEITFKEFARLAKEIPELCERRPYRYYWKEKGKWQVPWYRDLVFGYRDLLPEEVPKPFSYGVTYEAYTLNTPLYLQHLARTLRQNGVTILRDRVSSLDEAYNLPSVGPVDLVINATGLGARALLGVEDPRVFPAKGQTILVEAPDVKTCYGVEDTHKVEGQRVYIIPRPGKANHVILGGCYLPNDWSTNVNKEVAKHILRDCYELCPALDGKGGKGSIGDIKIVARNVGLRPVREGGFRLEMEDRIIGQGKAEKEEDAIFPSARGKRGDGRKVAVLHAYGIGPAGYQSSLGVAKEAGELMDEWLKTRNKAKL
ncbi:uncharacterized protein I303_108187 [Kwoniella dejecticola CBS 10117]|uniref:D-amino-acid oxidase n=1 Tax=Kwoniella dejecticola CBS 10117 TaxID=1296121 RepID=A0A1A5ZY30_9TREE|nr:D-amino-acid oxidase [Kwoniella dejecticola CBS 10117]OBR82720.1 D-amino-acid oxidase [Kwoniella dejecticola CBS 10117]